MIHFDLDDRYQDELIVGSAISRREGTVFSVLVHLALLAAFILGPQLPVFQTSPEERERERQLAEQQRDRDRATFVFVQPKVEVQSKPPQRAEMSDLDRKAQAPQAAPVPENPLPFSRGNSSERTESAPAEQAKGPQNPEPQPPEPPKPEQQIVRNLPPADSGLQRPSDTPRPKPPGALGDALRNLQRYVQNETFNNPQGGKNDPGSEIQFDTKGVEFGPWLRRFVAQVRGNWLIPPAAMTFRGRVVLQFNIHKSGAITDLIVLSPSSIDGFNRAAFNAILSSNPTQPLPPEYPDEKALFTVTFYYNETPPGSGQ